MAGEKGREPQASADGASDPKKDSVQRQVRREGAPPSGAAGPASWETATWSGGIAPPRIDADTGPPIGRAAPRPMRLVRIEPMLVRGQLVDIDPVRSPVRLGRAESNQIRLFTASSSREHATIACSRDGDWILTAMPGTHVEIDGYPAAEPVALETDMNIVLGEDHLRCEMNAALLRDEEVTETEGASMMPGEMEWPKWAFGGLIGLCLGVAILIWFVD